MKQQKTQKLLNIDKKPKNRNIFLLKNAIVIDSMFPSGNIGYARSISTSPHIIQLSGNPDHPNDQYARYWLYFRMKGYKQNDKITFILKNANYLRKFITKQKCLLKPKLLYKIQDGQWRPVSQDLQIQTMPDDKIDAKIQFCMSDQTYSLQQKIPTISRDLNQTHMSDWSRQNMQIPEIYFAINYPYSEEDLFKFIDLVKQSSQFKFNQFMNRNNAPASIQYKQQIVAKQLDIPYFNEQILIYSVQRRKISLITLTSSNNIQSFNEKQQKIDENIFPYPKDRPFKQFYQQQQDLRKNQLYSFQAECILHKSLPLSFYKE